MLNFLCQSRVQFISYISVFSTNRPGYFWARNSIQNGQFLAGHWERARAANQINPVPVVSPPLPPHTQTQTPAPFDLVSDVVDDNSIFKNPKWGWQVTHGARLDPVAAAAHSAMWQRHRIRLSQIGSQYREQIMPFYFFERIMLHTLVDRVYIGKSRNVDNMRGEISQATQMTAILLG